MNPKKTIYLLGAGASHASMPVQQELASDALAVFESFLAKIMDDRKHLEGSEEYDYEFKRYPNKLLKMEERLQKYTEVMRKCLEYPSVDTLAKEYYLTDRVNSLSEVRQAVSLYFHIRQFQPRLHRKFSRIERKGGDGNWSPTNLKTNDPRYIGWITSIATLASVKSRTIFPDNVSVLSYNYDLQAEMAVMNLAESSLEDCVSNDSPSKIYHLNGIASKDNLNESTAGLSRWDANAIPECEVSYAWDGIYKSFPELESIIDECEVLVVIGYSFPVYNREIDRQLLEGPKLAKVYLQDLPDSLVGIQDRVESLIGERCTQAYGDDMEMFAQKGFGVDDRPSTHKYPRIMIEAVKSVDQFHIPFELI